jgi:hypothetical protein
MQASQSDLVRATFCIVLRCAPFKRKRQTFFLVDIVGGEVQYGPLGTAAAYRPIVPATGDCDDGEIDGIIGRGNRSTRRKPAPVPLCPPQTPHAARTLIWVAAVGSQRLTA